MRKYIILIILLGISANCFGMSLTQEQFDNLDYCDEQVRATYPQFKGFNGSKDDMTVYGVSETAVYGIISKIKFDEVNADKYEYEQELELVREKIIDEVIKEVEASGKSLKYKDKVKETLMKERK